MVGHRNVRLGYLDDFDDARRVYLGAKVLLQVFDRPFAVSFGCQRPGPRTDDHRPVTDPSLEPLILNNACAARSAMLAPLGRHD
jgi:hypothetical protein